MLNKEMVIPEVVIFWKRGYKVILGIALPIVLLFLYNRYLFDRSLYNLRYALDRIQDVKTLDDAAQLAFILDNMLFQETSSDELEATVFSSTEMAKEIASNPQSLAQIEDSKYVLKKALEEKQKARPALLSFIDKFSQFFLGTPKAVSTDYLLRQAMYIKNRIASAKGKDEKQRLYFLLGNIYSQLKQFSQAQEAFENAVQLVPDNKLSQRAQFGQAWNAKRQGKLDEALSQFILIVEKGLDRNLVILSLFQQADIYRKKKDYTKAVEIYRQIQKETQDKELLKIAELNIRQVYLYHLKNYDLAKSAIEGSRLLKEDKEFEQHIRVTTNLAIGLDLRRQGLRLLKEAIELNLESKLKDAIFKFEQVMGMLPEDGVSILGKALGLLWLKEKASSSFFAKEAVRLSPNDELVSLDAGYIFLQLGLVDEAIVEYQRFVSQGSSSARIYYNLGYAYILLGKFREAQSAFEKAIDIDPSLYQAYNNLGWCLWQSKQYNQAINAFEASIKRNPDFCDALYNLARIYKEIGRLEEARSNLLHLLQLNPKYHKAQEFLREVENIIKEQTEQEAE